MTYESFQALFSALWSEKTSIIAMLLIVIAMCALVFMLRKAGARLTPFRLNSFLLFILMGFVLIPLNYWLPLICITIGALIFSGLVFVALYKYTGMQHHRIKKTALGFAFVNSKTQYAVCLSDDEIQGSRYLKPLRLALNKWMTFEILSSNSSHHRLEQSNHRIFIPPFCSKGNPKSEFRVRFVMRGIECGSTLFCRIKAKGLRGLICPWEIPIELKFPDEDVLSEGFCRSQKPYANTENPSAPLNSVSKETLFASDHFLHLGPYQRGEKLSLIHFPASLRLAKPVSRKFSAPMEAKALVALGFGRRVKNSGTAELCLSAVGQILAEHRNAKVTSDIVVFDMVRLLQTSCSPQKPLLQVARNLCQLTPGTEEEDEFCILEELGQKIRSYQVVRFVLGSAGTLDFARLFTVGRLFRKNGVKVVASVFIPELFKNSPNHADIANYFILTEMALEVQKEALRNGVELLWCRDFKFVSQGNRIFNEMANKLPKQVFQ
jgi:hypothetical protein